MIITINNRFVNNLKSDLQLFCVKS